nr:hypothetical protein [Tanacetum cinerariifolium]
SKSKDTAWNEFSSTVESTQKPRKPTRKDTHVPQPGGPTESIANEAVHKELDDRLVKDATTASSLVAVQDSGGGLRYQETIGDTIAQTRFESVSKHSSDSLLARGNTLQCDEDRLKLDELMELCTNLQNIVLDLEKTKTTQFNEITSLKRRSEESLGEEASKQERRIDDIDADEDITLNMEGYKLKDLKLKEFDSIQEMFDKAFKRVNTFADFRTELVEGKEKIARTELEQEINNKQKVEDDKEKAELKQEDLKDLYKLVKARYGSTRPVKSMDYLLWSDMKTMFEPHIEDEVWKMQQGYKVLEWKLYDSCEVHSLMMQSMQIYMLVEKKGIGGGRGEDGKVVGVAGKVEEWDNRAWRENGLGMNSVYGFKRGGRTREIFG